jgi:hypothetical protein
MREIDSPPEGLYNAEGLRIIGISEAKRRVMPVQAADWGPLPEEKPERRSNYFPRLSLEPRDSAMQGLHRRAVFFQRNGLIPNAERR